MSETSSIPSSLPEFFTVLPDRAEFRPRANTTLWPAARLITRAMEYAREQKIRKLLVDITGLTGFSAPNLGERYYIMHEWADAARGQLRVVFFAPKEMIDNEKFGVTAARNAGLEMEAFTTEAEALTWLMAEEKKN